MDRLVIIGNGFDRAHNLPTSYYDFKEYLRIYAREFYEAICILTSCKINSRFQRMAYLCGFCVLYR